MSINIETVELSNIRSHEYMLFQPAKEGATSIVGRNGTGKSTIVDSIAWTLFGTKPRGVSRNSSIRREGSDPKKDKAYAEVTVNVDGAKLRINRRMVSKAGTVECDVWEEKGGSWEHVAGPAVSHTETYIKKRLKMDERGFLTATLVQQKQVDNLMTSTPKERATVIEKLTGISSITTALSKARQEYNDQKKLLDNNNFDESIGKTLTKDLAKLEKQSATIKNRGIRLKSSTDKLEEQISELSTTITESERHQRQLLVWETRLEAIRGTISEVDEERAKLRKTLKAMGPTIKLSEIQPKVESIRNQLSRARSNEERDKKELGIISETLTKLEKTFRSAKISTLQELEDKYDYYTSRVSKAQDFLMKLNDSRSRAETEAKQYGTAIRVISGDDGTCPTCLQKVEHPDAALNLLHSQKETCENTIVTTRSKITEVEEKLTKYKNNVTKLDEIRRNLEERDALLDRRNELEESELSNSKTISDLEIDLKIHQSMFEAAKETSETKEKYDSLRETLLKLKNEETEITGNISTILDAGNTVLNEKQLESAKSKLSTLQGKYNNNNVQLAELRGELAVILEKITQVSKDLDSFNKEAVLYADALKSMEVASNTVKVLEKFREDRINNSVPIIEAHASDLVSRFTDGQFRGVELDHKFNTTVVLSDGSKRPVGLLSGGELSATAMALRLAISMLLNGRSSNNSIILDEVLVSQDNARAENILTTIKEVSDGQVIIIAHNDTINSIADKVVELDDK